MEGIQNFSTLVANALEDLCNLERDHFLKWTHIVESSDIFCGFPHIQNHILDIDPATGRLVVNIDVKLEAFIQNARQLSALGFGMPKAVSDMVNEAQKFLPLGGALHGIANLYNNLASQVLTFQRPMLLNQALEFEQLVKSSGIGGSFADMNVDKWDICKKKVQDLYFAAESLNHKNQELCSLHFHLIENCLLPLLGTDVGLSGHTWNEQVHLMKSAFDTVSSQTKPSNTQMWKLQLDHQLFKVSTFNFLVFNENLNKILGAISVELTMKNSLVGYKPPLEEVKATYFRDIKKLTNMFTQLSGVCNKSLEEILDHCGQPLAVAFERCEYVFETLETLRAAYKDWALWDCVSEIIAYADEYLQNIAEWEEMFRQIKVRSVFFDHSTERKWAYHIWYSKGKRQGLRMYSNRAQISWGSYQVDFIQNHNGGGTSAGV